MESNCWPWITTTKITAGAWMGHDKQEMLCAFAKPGHTCFHQGSLKDSVNSEAERKAQLGAWVSIRAAQHIQESHCLLPLGAERQKAQCTPKLKEQKSSIVLLKSVSKLHWLYGGPNSSSYAYSNYFSDLKERGRSLPMTMVSLFTFCCERMGHLLIFLKEKLILG